MIASGERASPDELLVAEARVEVGARLALTAPPGGDFGQARIIEAPRLGPDAGVEDSDDDVSGTGFRVRNAGAELG